jgi:Family of unknown function (DUF5767)
MATIYEMEEVSRKMGGPDLGLSSELGNVINLNDMGDDLGMSLLANPSKTMGSSSSGQSVNVSSRPPEPPSISINTNSIGLQEIDIAPLEPMNIGSDFPSAPVNIEIRKESGGDVGANLFSNQQTATGPVFSLPASRDPEAEKKEKVELINKLQRLEAKGFPVTRHYTMDNSLEEIKQEYLRLVDARNLETSLRFQRQMLMGVVTGMEWMNNKFDPFDLKLEGWSESVHENVEDFDEIFEELYDKYKDRGKVAPEVRLIMALAGSGFMCHMSNSFFRQKMPTMDEVLRKNPELARQMAAAAASQAGPGFGNFMGMAMGVQQPQGMPQSMPQPMQQFPQQQQFPQPPQQMPQAGPVFNNSSRVPNVPQPVASVEPRRATARREMRGPTGVDDILKTFAEVRMAEEVIETVLPNMSMMGGGMMGGGPTLASDIQSVQSEEIRSQGESVRTAGGGRRKKRNTPILGNEIAINV